MHVQCIGGQLNLEWSVYVGREIESQHILIAKQTIFVERCTNNNNRPNRTITDLPVPVLCGGGKRRYNPILKD